MKNLTPKDVEILSDALKAFISDDIEDIDYEDKLKQNSLAFEILLKLGRYETEFFIAEYTLMYFALAYYQDEYEVSDIDFIINNLLILLRNQLRALGVDVSSSK